ncbi:hypothetical protein K491DRAFT_718304 [Lophiostoma macrostomum CBS 122681]|uniref:Uncharacterized protein n=1 Tax=Lophiostoma macrostomum CBS 122681 TaxID=1314788 RepID=A0A6A6SZP9_9PLEO|nr:hypothetical protein K491DRAFT_718304 [Lophiostoma macrostomum CBS 122681]
MREPTEEPKADDVVIYCDGKRFEVVTGGSPAWLKDNDRQGIKVGIGKSDSLKRCNDGNLLSLSGHALGVTWQTPAGIPEGQSASKDFPAAVQFCAITVKGVKDGIFDSVHHEAFRLERILGKSKKKLSGSSYAFRPIDAMNQLSLVLLHELTHTRGAGQLDDVPINARFLPFGKTSRAYRWDRIKRLVREGPYVDRQKFGAPDNNSDSIAYFALGCWLMSRSNEPYKIEDEGTVTRLPAQIIFPE